MSDKHITVWHTVVTNVRKPDPIDQTYYSFNLDSPYGTWLVKEDPGLAPGDRVRITITKEPSDATRIQTS